MDPLRDFLESVRRHGAAQGNFRGLLHVLIGRRVARADGAPVSAGMTWREVAALLKRVRWDPSAAAELGLDPEQLPPRDRQRFWYAAITQAGVDTAAARAAGDRLAAACAALGYVVGPAPVGRPS